MKNRCWWDVMLSISAMFKEKQCLENNFGDTEQQDTNSFLEIDTPRQF